MRWPRSGFRNGDLISGEEWDNYNPNANDAGKTITAKVSGNGQNGVRSNEIQISSTILGTSWETMEYDATLLEEREDNDGHKWSAGQQCKIRLILNFHSISTCMMECITIITTSTDTKFIYEYVYPNYKVNGNKVSLFTLDYYWGPDYERVYVEHPFFSGEGGTINGSKIVFPNAIQLSEDGPEDVEFTKQ